MNFLYIPTVPITNIQIKTDTTISIEPKPMTIDQFKSNGNIIGLVIVVLFFIIVIYKQIKNS